jgi:type II secretory pathway component GspD/PulD (secretin)
MEERATNTDTGVPFFSRIPWFGNAFKNTNKDNRVVEMVIFIKATLIPTSGKITKQDIDFYKKFTNDPRPLTF